MPKRCVVIGGDAAGMTAASKLRRETGDDVEIVVLERGHWTSYSACGIPYWIAGDVPDVNDLVARSPEEHRERGIDVRMGWRATALDTAARTVSAVRPDGATETIDYDEVLIATGATPRVPDVPGNDAAGIMAVKTLDDGTALIAEVERRDPQNVVIVGSGYIGVEMAETCVRRGLNTTVVDRNEAPLTILDPDIGHKIAEAMRSEGITLHLGTETAGFGVDDDGHVASVQIDGRGLAADLVIVASGIDPSTQLADEAGLPRGVRGALAADERQRVTDGVWAAGDCVETLHRITGETVYVPLGTHANKQGLVAGHNIAAVMNGSDPTMMFPGVVGTSITQFCDLEIASTGLNSAQATKAGWDFEAATIESTTRAGYMPGAEPMVVRVLAEIGTGRLLGGQIVGGAGAGKRIDTLATALWHEASAADLMMSDLSYVPPISGVWDPVQVAARAVDSRIRR